MPDRQLFLHRLAKLFKFIVLIHLVWFLFWLIAGLLLEMPIEKTNIWLTALLIMLYIISRLLVKKTRPNDY